MTASSLKIRALKSVGWTTVGYIVSQVLRLISNLALTRVLAPEHFGTMAIVTVFLIGLSMFSDIGIGPNIIQNRRSHEQPFRDAAWTLQVIRGGILWLLCILAGWPLAQFYDNEQLLWLVPAAGLIALIQGFNSTAIYTAEKELGVARLVLSELTAQLVSLVLMLLVAQVWPSIWVLVLGAWTAALIKLTASHLVLPASGNRWNWDIKMFAELANFGKWIFLSTLLSFASNSTASMVLGKFVSMHEVGLFAIAATLAKAVEQAFHQVAHRTLFPLYNKIKSLPPEEIIKKIRIIRLGVMALFMPTLWVLIIFAQSITELLFDFRYHDIAWILRFYAFGLIPTIVSGLGPFYLANGDARMMCIMSGIRFVSYLGAIVVGWYAAGVQGMIAGMSCFTFISYIAEAIGQHRYRVWLPKLDALGFCLSAVVLGGTYALWGFH